MEQNQTTPNERIERPYNMMRVIAKDPDSNKILLAGFEDHIGDVWFDDIKFFSKYYGYRTAPIKKFPIK